MFNNSLYNSLLYNNNIILSECDIVYSVLPVSNLDVVYNYYHLASVDLDLVYDYILAGDFDLVYHLLQSTTSSINVIYTYSSSASTLVGEPLPIVYDFTETLIGDPLEIVYGFMPQGNLDLVYRYGFDNYISKDLNVVYNLSEYLLADALELVYDYSALTETASQLDVIYDYIIADVITPTPIPIVDNYVPYGGYVPDHILFDYIYYNEEDTYAGTTVWLIEATLPPAYVSSLNYATEITVVNNECATVSAQRMVQLTPSEMQNMAQESDRLAQIENIPSAHLDDILGNPLIYVYKNPGDLTNIRDIKIDVSVISRENVHLPNPQKAVYVYYGRNGNRQLEYYEGTYDQIIDQINTYSKVMYAEEADLVNDKLASTRNVMLQNKNNSPHMALWKALGVIQCLMRKRFDDYANGFFTRIASMPFLKRLADRLNTNQWFYLKWKRIAGALLAPLESSEGNNLLNINSTVFMAITDDTFNTWEDNGVGSQRVRPRKEWAAVKIDEEIIYYDWIGLASDVCGAAFGLLWPEGNPSSCPGSFKYYNDDDIHYVMRIVQRGAQETTIVDHKKGSTITYVPTDLGTFGNDTRLLAKVIKEPDSEFRERLRLYQGEKATKPRFRKAFDSLERIIPDSTIDFWDMADMGTWSSDRPVVIDKQVGWLLGIPTRTELEQTTYLGHKIYSQGYWEWVDGGPQFDYPGEIKGRYPFFVKADNWWFDEALLQEVVNRFKSAGTSANYMVNKGVQAYDTSISTEDAITPIRRIGNDNWFANSEFNDGVYVDTLSQIVEGFPTDWEIGLYKSSTYYDLGGLTGFEDLLSSDYHTVGPIEVINSTYTEDGDTKYFNGFPPFSINIETLGSSAEKIAFYQQLDQLSHYGELGEDTVPDGSYIVQFLLRKSDKTAITSSDVEPFIQLLDDPNTMISVDSTILPAGDGWYYLCYAVDVPIYAPMLRCGILIPVSKNIEICRSYLLTGQETQLTTGIDSSQLYCQVDDDLLYAAGIALIDDEPVIFTSVNGDKIQLMTRDSGAAHLAGVDVKMIGAFPRNTQQLLSLNYSLTLNKTYGSLDLNYNYSV